uniref:hypothetical protein n=1 Tax=Alistipes sp. TaxID=1872444 RepID=UPI0040566DDA
MVERHYEDPLRITLKANIPSDDILCVFQRNIIPDFEVVIRSSNDSGGTDFVAKCRDGVLENCSAHYTYDRHLTVLISASNHGLGLGDLSARLILYGYFGPCADCPEPILTLYRDLSVRLVDDPSLTGTGSDFSAELAASFVSITQREFHIQAVRNPKVKGELATLIQEWGPELADPTKYRIFLLRKRRKSRKGSYWTIPATAKPSATNLKISSWPISSSSAKQPIFMVSDGDWNDHSPSWGELRENGGYHLSDVLNIRLTDKGVFHNGRKKMTIGFGIFRRDERLDKWVQCSNTASVDIYASKKGGVTICANR